MITDQIKQLLESNAIAFATVNEKGEPHGIAVACPKIISDTELLLTDNFMGETRTNLEKNVNVALTVWNNDWEEECLGFELKGVAEIVKDNEHHNLLRSMEDNEGLPCKAGILIKVTRVKQLHE